MPFLSKDYDLILVDLPGHSGSKEIIFTLNNAVHGLSHLISTQVVGGKAHIVGMSQGGFIALEFARRCPELILSIFCTGCAPFSGFRHWMASKPRLLGGITLATDKLATDAVFWWSRGLEPLPGLREEIRKNSSMALLKAGYAACVEVSLERLAEIRDVRIAIVAGGKLDSVEDARNAGKVLRKNNPQCKAFVVRNAIHWWSLQFPELFARGVRDWVEGSEMQKEFEALP
jgi:pimeloyl-ACP methyl ester carboxylesterase